MKARFSEARTVGPCLEPKIDVVIPFNSRLLGIFGGEHSPEMDNDPYSYSVVQYNWANVCSTSAEVTSNDGWVKESPKKCTKHSALQGYSNLPRYTLR